MAPVTPKPRFIPLRLL